MFRAEDYHCCRLLGKPRFLKTLEPGRGGGCCRPRPSSLFMLPSRMGSNVDNKSYGSTGNITSSEMDCNILRRRMRRAMVTLQIRKESLILCVMQPGSEKRGREEFRAV